jgi:hypothetical protein
MHSRGGVGPSVRGGRAGSPCGPVHWWMQMFRKKGYNDGGMEIGPR